MEEVLITKNDNGLGIITLNRPHALNALTYDMITTIWDTLKKWEKDDDISLIMFDGAGDRAFCAGGDIKAVYESRYNPELNGKVEKFFEVEYGLDSYIYTYSKPIISNLDGIVMGGGVGLVNGTDYRIITENTLWAMPEMSIGFFTDVGAAYFFNRAPGYVGRYLALTANSIKGKDVIYIKAADALIETEQLDDFFNEVKQMDWNNTNVDNTLNKLINTYDKQQLHKSELAKFEQKINEHFKYETVEQIIESLKNDDDDFAQETKKTMLSKSPFSLKITLKQQIDCADMSIEQCLKVDTILANNFLKHDDFYEGIRSVLIDRDNNPQYKYKTLSDVSDEVVESFFKP